MGSDPNDGDNWRSSTEYGGSPGRAGAGPLVDVVVNEVLSHTDPPDLDAIELHNTTSASIDISHWWLSDADADYQKFRIPRGHDPAGGRLSGLRRERFQPVRRCRSCGFRLGRRSRRRGLAAGRQRPGPADAIRGPCDVHGSGQRRIVRPLAQRHGRVVSDGLADAGFRERPAPAWRGQQRPARGTGRRQRIELQPAAGRLRIHRTVQCLGRTTCRCTIRLNPAHPWKFDGVDYAFPAGTVLPSHGVALVVPVDPALFRAPTTCLRTCRSWGRTRER